MSTTSSGLTTEEMHALMPFTKTLGIEVVRVNLGGVGNHQPPPPFSR